MLVPSTHPNRIPGLLVWRLGDRDARARGDGSHPRDPAKRQALIQAADAPFDTWLEDVALVGR
jgi:hypothetical protein